MSWRQWHRFGRWEFKTPLQQLCAVTAISEEGKKEVAIMGEDVKKVATQVDTIEEEVCAKGGGSDTGACQENSANGGGVGNN